MARFNGLLDPLIPPDMRAGPSELLRKMRFIAVGTLVLVPLGVIFTVQRLILEPGLGVTFITLFAATLLFAVNPLLLRWTRNYVLSGVVLTASLMGCIGVVAYHNGGVYAPALGFMPLLPLLAILVMGSAGALFTTLMTIALLGYFHFIEAQGIPLPGTLSPNKLLWVRFMVISSLCAALAVLAWFYERSRLQALTLAQNRLQELEQLNLELRAANQRIEEVSRAKSEFLTHINHELRTPLNGIIGMADLLRRAELGEAQRDQIETIRICGERQLQLINSLLDLSKIESGRFQLDNERFDLQALIDDVVQMFRGQAVEKGLGCITRTYCEEPIWLWGDALRLNQVLMNLVGNAIKFTDRGSVSLALEERAEDAESLSFAILVRDTGIGLDAAAVASIFEPFTQADDSITRRFGGSGLGLSICQNLVELMGGRILVDSDPGAGTLFTVELCLKKAPSAAEKAAEPGLNPKGPFTPMRPPANWGDGRMILVVDDNLTNQKVTGLHLMAQGFEVRFASNGQEALSCLRNQRVDAVLMDCQMPEMDGYEATRQIRALSNDRAQVPVIALTAHTLEHEVRKAYDAGMNAHLPKPFQAEELESTLKKFF